MGLLSEIKDAVNWDAPAVDLQSSLREVIQKMVDSDASAVVVKTDDAVVGVVTEMDLLDCISNQNDLDETRVSDFFTACELITSQPAKNPCIQLDESESVENAIKILAAAGTHNLVVAGSKERSSGIVSSRDLLKLLVS